MNQYEIMFILKPTLSKEEIKSSIEKYHKILEDKGAKVVEKKEIGMQELAYPVKKQQTGYYYLMNIEAKDDEAIKEFNRVSLISSDIMRHLITKQEE